MSAERPQSDQTLLRIFHDDAPAVAKLLVLGINTSRFIKAATVGPLWQAPDDESRAAAAQGDADIKDGAAGDYGGDGDSSEDEGDSGGEGFDDVDDGAAATDEEDEETEAEEEPEEETEKENTTGHSTISAVLRAYERLLRGEPASTSVREAPTVSPTNNATLEAEPPSRSNSNGSEDDGIQGDSDFESPSTRRRRAKSFALRAENDREELQNPAAAETPPIRRDRDDESDEHGRSSHNAITKSLAMYLPELKVCLPRACNQRRPAKQASSRHPQTHTKQRKKSVVEELREHLEEVLTDLNKYQIERERMLRKSMKPLLRTVRAGNRYNEHSCLASLYRSRLQCVSASHDIQGSVVDVCFEPSGRAPLLLACSVSGEIDESLQSVAAAATHTAVLYNYRVGAMWPLEGHGSSTVSEVAYAQNSTRVLTAGFDGNLCLWDVTQCSTTADAEVPLLAKIKCL